MKKLRRELDMVAYRTGSNAIAEKVRSLEEFKSAYRIHCYVSAIGNEADTLGLLYTMLDAGKIVAVPECLYDTRELRSLAIHSLEELRPAKHGLMEPEYEPSRVVPSEILNLVIAPVVAFDRNGGRLGMGGGFYDSFLGGCTCSIIGIAYAFQEVAHVPLEPHDRKLDIIVTDREVIRPHHEQ